MVNIFLCRRKDKILSLTNIPVADACLIRKLRHILKIIYIGHMISNDCVCRKPTLRLSTTCLYTQEKLIVLLDGFRKCHGDSGSLF